MGYFQAKSDLRFILEFKDHIMKLWKIETEANERIGGRRRLTTSSEYQAVLQAEASANNNYQNIRESVSKALLRAMQIAQKLKISITGKSLPPPAVGGAIISINLFSAILNDTSYGGVSRQWIYDALNQTIGACENNVDIEFKRLINPLYWIKELLIIIIRIPFMLIEASGFDVTKFEDHFLSKLFKFLEIIIIIFILIKLGMKREQLSQFMMNFFLK